MKIPRRWRRLPDTLRRNRVVETLTVNDDFTDRETDLPDLLATRRPVFGGAQEVKRGRVRRWLRPTLGWRYGVHQDRRHDGAAGVAVFWDRLVCRRLGKATDDSERLGRGWLELTPAGGGLLARGVVWQDLAVPALRVRIRVASTHRPPRRNRNQWPAFDTRLAEFCADSPLPVIVFMDANEAGGPGALCRLTGLPWRGVGIDGALTALKVPGGATALPRRHSDHAAVSIPVKL